MKTEDECQSRLRVTEKGQGGQQCRKKVGHSGYHCYYTPFHYYIEWDDRGYIRTTHGK